MSQPQTFRDFVGAAYANGAVKNMSFADGPIGQLSVADALAKLTKEAVALVDGIANVKAPSAAEREAAGEAHRINVWIKSIGADNSEIAAAMQRAVARAS